MPRLPKCCPAHWAATSRTEMRRADRSCPCRGACGCVKALRRHR